MAKDDRYVLKSIPGGPADERDPAWLAYDRLAQRNVAGPMRRAKAEDTVRQLNTEGERPACDVNLTVVPGTEFEFSPRETSYLRPFVEIRVPAESRTRAVMAIAHQVAARVEALSPSGACWGVLVERLGEGHASVLLLVTTHDQEYYDAHAVLRDSVAGAVR